MKELLVRSHLGLGDQLVCCGIVRTLSDNFKVVVLCKQHNLTSVKFMFRDLAQVEVFPLESESADREADRLCETLEKTGYQVLRLGATGIQPFNAQIWDQEFYRQADVPFEDNWQKFHVERNLERELKPPKRDYVFIHHDLKRGFAIQDKHLPKKSERVFADCSKTDNIFDWCSIVEGAKELHFIDSCFAILADHLSNLKCKRMVIHDYARKGLPPTYRKDWERIL